MNQQKNDNKQLSVLETLKPTESSLKLMINEYKPQLLKRACDNIRTLSEDKQDQFLERLIFSIAKDENLKKCFTSAEGRYSIFELVNDCLKTGLELYTHAYPVPYNRKVIKTINNKSVENWVTEASFQVNKSGYKALLCGMDKPIFKNLLSSIVYEKEKDKIKINKATGEVDHPIFIDADRGKPIGVWVQCEHLDGHKEVEFYPIKRIFEIRDNHSRPYQDYLNKKIKTCAWITDETPMIEKTGIKQFCKPYAEINEALQAAYYSDGEYIPPEKKDNAEVAEIILDKAIDDLEIESEDIKEEVQEEEKKESDSLF